MAEAQRTGEPGRMTRRGFMRWMAAAGLALPAASLAAACAPAAAPSPTAAPAKPTEAPKPAEAKPTEAAKPAASPAAQAAPPAVKPAEKPANLDQLIEGAKREGELHWIDPSVQQFNDDLFHSAFRKKYGLPDSFQIRHTFKGTGDIVTQVQQEVQAGRVTVDFVFIGDLPLFKGLERANALLEYRPSGLPAIEAMAKKLNFPVGTSTWWTITSYTFVPAWNKKFWDKDVKSWFDTIDPALRDKVIQGDIRTSSTQTDTYIGLRKSLSADYFKQFAELNPQLIFRTPEQQQKLTSGERVLTNFQISARPLQAMRQDPSLSFGVAFPSEGVVPLPILAGVLSGAAHPNAAKLFGEFLTSQEGQQLWLDAEVQWPLRTDVTYSDEVKRFLTPLDQVKALTLDWETLGAKERDEARAEFRQIFKVT